MARAKKKAQTKKKTAPATKKKVVKKKAVKKKAAPAKKKTAKKTPAKKAPAKKKVTKKKATKKKTAARSTAASKKNKVSKKKAPAKKTAAKKTPAKKKAAAKTKAPAAKKASAAAAKKKAAPKPAAEAPKPKKKAKPRKPAKNVAMAQPVANKPESSTKSSGSRGRVVNLADVKLPNGYVPNEKEEYMGPKQLVYFRNKLKAWREELIEESQETLNHLRSEIRDVGDEAERASRESDNILELRTRDRYRKLLKKIDDAVKRIEDGSYGYCEETGEEIGLGRLEARPIATLTVDAQERREMFQRQFREDR